MGVQSTWLVLATLASMGCRSTGSSTAGIDPPPRIPLEDFLREPQRHNRQLSPDGRSYAFLSRLDGKAHLFSRAIPDGEAVDLTPEPGVTVRDYLWLPDGRLLSIGVQPGGELRVFLVAPDHGESARIISGSGTLEILDPLPLAPGIAAVLHGADGGVPRPHQLDLTSGTLIPVSAPGGDVERWVFDHAGELRCALRLGGLRNELLCKRAATGTFRRVLVLDAVRDLFIPAVFTADNRLLVAYSNIGRERVAVVTVDPETGEETGVLFEHPDYDVFGDDESDHIRFSAYRREISFAFYTTQRRTYRFFDSVSRRIIDALGERFPGHVIRLPSSSADERFFLVKVSGDRLAGEYYLYDVEKDTTTFLESDCPWLQERELAPKHPISFRARDGTNVHGYLVLPVGLPARNLPLVVYPHGGPHWRDVWEMGRFREVQLLANRGLGVLLVNFRGSTGYGKTFLTEGFKENGLKVQDDITDGVNYVVSRGIADPARIAIIGGSYGGYAVLAGLAFTPELYACGVDLFGVSSFFTFLDALSRFTDMSVMYERVGHPERDRKLLKRTSPLFHVDSIRVPLLVAQGGRDPVVPRAESDQIVTALRRRGVPVTYIFHEDEGHGYFAQEDHWLELWRTIEVFLAEHLGEGSP